MAPLECGRALGVGAPCQWSRPGFCRRRGFSSTRMLASACTGPPMLRSCSLCMMVSRCFMTGNLDARRRRVMKWLSSARILQICCGLLVRPPASHFGRRSAYVLNGRDVHARSAREMPACLPRCQLFQEPPLLLHSKFLWRLFYNVNSGEPDPFKPADLKALRLLPWYPKAARLGNEPAASARPLLGTFRLPTCSNMCDRVAAKESPNIAQCRLHRKPGYHTSRKERTAVSRHRFECFPQR